MAESLAAVDVASVEKIHMALVGWIAKDTLDHPFFPHIATETLNVTSAPDAAMANLAAWLHQDHTIANRS